MIKTQRVLIIDDEKINLKFLSHILRNELDVTLAKSGKQGIRKALEVAPDLILLDIRMPDMDGFETLKALKNDLRTNTIPVILISSLDTPQNEEKGLLLGANDFIYKPFNVAVVQARIRLQLQLAKQTKMLESLAHIDALSSLANRRKYQEVSNAEWIRCQQQGSHLSLIVLDIDNFKQYNDYHGHSAGDRLIQQIAQVLSTRFLGVKKLVARYGGEEFVALLSDCSKEHALELVQEVVVAIEELGLFYQESIDSGCVTISAGGATCIPDHTLNIDKLFTLADKALYAAKRKGKNQAQWGC